MPPDMKNPAAGDGRALRNLSDAGERDRLDHNTPPLDLEADEAWKARIVRDAERFMARKSSASRYRRGRT